MEGALLTQTAPVANTGEHWIKDPAGAFGAWDRWTQGTGLPIHTGYFIPDLRTVELGCKTTVTVISLAYP